MRDVGRKRVREALAVQRGAQDVFLKHLKGCFSCHRAVRDSDPFRYCPHGWELAKIAKQAEVTLAAARGHVRRRCDGEQLVMF